MPVAASIIIRTLNEAKHLGRLMEGIYQQNFRDWEIILVDSGSTDGTLDIAQRYEAPYLSHPQRAVHLWAFVELGLPCCSR